MARPTKGSRKAKVSQVMREYKEGSLQSSRGQTVTTPKQAIALSEAGLSKPPARRQQARRQKATPPDVVVVERS